jgi:hypothetical protein
MRGSAIEDGVAADAKVTKRKTAMVDDGRATERPRFWRVRFSIGSLLLLMALVGLAITLGITYRKLDRAERELSAMRPLSRDEVAQQFERNTSFGSHRTTVTDVRYSQKDDAYRVTFSWVDSTTNKEWSTDLTLRSDGFGLYQGVIDVPEFTKQLSSFGVTGSHRVFVGKSSTLKAK